jgi:hypothetical protein
LHLAVAHPALPVLLGPEHDQELPSARHQLAQSPLLGVLQRARHGPDLRGEQRDHLGVEALGLGETADRGQRHGSDAR